MMRTYKANQSQTLSSRLGSILNKENWFFIFVFLLALILRIKDIGLFLPYFEAGDEKFLVESSLNIIRTGDLNPHFFWYGSFPIYWISAIYYLVILILWPFSNQSSLASFIGNLNIYDYHFLFFYIGRITSVLFSLLTIYLLYAIGKNLFGKKTGKIILFLSSFNVFHAFLSQLFKVDISLSFWILATVYFALKILESGKIINYVLGGICVGLAMSTKYNFLAFIPLAAARVLKDKEWKSLFELKLFLAGYVAAVTFIVTCPFSILDFKDFYSQLYFQMKTLQQGPYDPMSFLTGIPYLAPLIAIGGSDPLIAFSSVFGLIIVFRKDWRSAVLVSCFPVIYFIFAFGVSKLPNPQNIFPTFPFLVIFSGFFFKQFFESNRPRYRHLAVGIFILNIIFQILFYFIYLPPYQAWEYPYKESVKWIEKNIDKNSIVMSYYGSPGNFRYIKGSFGFAQEYMIRPKLKNYEENLVKFKPDFLILMNWGMEHQSNDDFKAYGNWVNAILKKPFSDYCLIKGFYLPKIYRGISEKFIPVSENYGLLIFQRKEVQGCEKES